MENEIKMAKLSEHSDIHRCIYLALDNYDDSHSLFFFLRDLDDE